MTIYKGYRFRTIDYIKIVFLCAPVITILEWMFTVFISLIPAVLTVATRRFIDSTLEVYNNNANVLKIVPALLLILLVICVQQINSSMLNAIHQTQKKNLSLKMIPKIIVKRSKLKYIYIENNNTWDLIDRTCSNASENIYNYYSNIISFTQNVLQIVSLLIVTISYVWWIGIVLLIICVPVILIAYKAGKEDYSAFENSKKIERKANYLHDILMDRYNAPERTLFGYKSYVQKKWEDLSDESRKIYNNAFIQNIIKIKAAELAITIAFSLMVCMFTYLILLGHIAVSMMIALVGALETFINVFSWDLSDNMISFAKSREYLNDLTDFFLLDEIVEEHECKKVKFENLEFKNVSFKYPGTDMYILKDFSIKLNKNRHYAVVGTNGCGKTTIVKLITGLYREYEGEIKLNGKELTEYSQSELNDVFSVVFQDFAKYNISFLENIVFDNNKKDENHYENLKKILGLNKIVETLPMKDETYLGKAHEKGLEISGGEWQKIAIARSLYKDSSFKILDEPTASLDPSAESMIYSMFQSICQNDTTLVITHRLAAAKFSDEIIVISDGAAVEIGSHNELMDSKGIYYKMFNTQKRSFE